MKRIIEGVTLLALISLLISSLALLSLGTAQSGTNKKGVINSEETWTRAGSPYTLIGPVAIDQGVTLSIEPGTIVNLGSYYIEVNGTLNAIGDPNDKVTLNGGQITFNNVSNNRNGQTYVGIIENGIINQTKIYSSIPIKIDSCIINGQITVSSSVISNNVVTGDIYSHSSQPDLGQHKDFDIDTSVISGNNVKGYIVVGQVGMGVTTAPAEAPRVFNNTVEGTIIAATPIGTPEIFNNTVSKGGIESDGYGYIYNNYVSGSQWGIRLEAVRVFSGNLPCYATVENNVVTGNSEGISMHLSSVHGGETRVPSILNNSISGNQIGISLSGYGYDANPIIRFNNLQDNSNYSFYLGETNNVNASLNWWGTTDELAIGGSIYDYKNDFKLGRVTFTPILTSPNPQAPGTVFIPGPTPTPYPTTTPSTETPTPPVPELSSNAVLILLAIMVSAALIIRNRGIRRQFSSQDLLSRAIFRFWAS